MSVLSDELKNDPLGRGYAAMPDINTIERDLNEKRYAVVGLIPIGTFISTLYDTGTFDAMFMAMLGGDATATAAMKKIELMKALGIENIDMGSDKANADLAASGVPQADIDALKAKATTIKSRAEVLGVTANDSTIPVALKENA